MVHLTETQTVCNICLDAMQGILHPWNCGNFTLYGIHEADGDKLEKLMAVYKFNSLAYTNLDVVLLRSPPYFCRT